MTIKAWLEGDSVDLEALTRQFSSADVRVVAEADGYFLTADEIDHPVEARRWDIPAAALLVKVNGLARAMDPNFRPVKLTGRFTNEAGLDIHFVEAHLTARATATASVSVTYADGSVPPAPPSPVPGYLALSDADPDVAEVLAILSSLEPLGWMQLFKIFEVVRDAVGTRIIVQNGWTTQATISAFTGSANRPDISGDGARHARMPGDPPRNRMSVEEGRSFISDLVKCWLEGHQHRGRQ